MDKTEEARPGAPSRAGAAALSGDAAGGGAGWTGFAARSELPGLSVAYDDAAATLTSRFTHDPRPNVTMQVVRSCNALYDAVARRQAADPLAFYVMGSAREDIYSYGGDFTAFLDIIARQDREAMSAYARGCVEAVHKVHTALGGETVTIAAVAGEALGGGLECALSCDLIVAERTAQLGLPETKFGLYPGMGAIAFLQRKVGRQLTEELVLSGRVMGAEEGAKLGIVDVVCEPGALAEAVRRTTADVAKRRATYGALLANRRNHDPVTLGELTGMVDRWTDDALALDRRGRRFIEILLSKQQARMAADPKIVPLRRGGA